MNRATSGRGRQPGARTRARGQSPCAPRTAAKLPASRQKRRRGPSFRARPHPRYCPVPPPLLASWRRAPCPGRFCSWPCPARVDRCFQCPGRRCRSGGHEPPCRATPRSNCRIMIDDIDEMDRDQSCGDGNLAVGADPSQVVCVPQGHHANAVSTTPPDGLIHRLAADPPPKPQFAVQLNERVGVFHDRSRSSRFEHPDLEVLKIGRHQTDPMAVVAHEVCRHQRPRNKVGFLDRAAHRAEDLCAGHLQIIMRDPQPLPPVSVECTSFSIETN